VSQAWRIPVLTYHGLHAPGWEYLENDHVALEQDLEVIASLGFRVVPLESVVSQALGRPVEGLENQRCVAITFDDGTDLDYRDFSHPDYGYLKSFRRILKERMDVGWKGEAPSATSFVIASPNAREDLDRACIAGRGQWGDDWWADAMEEGVLSIANHSWDHTHPSLEDIAVDRMHRGRFDTISDFEAADTEILQAEQFIREKLGAKSTGLFAYPYGHSNAFLAEEYFPSRQSWFEAAFTTAGEPVTPGCNRWLMPRYVCREHWFSPEELSKILL
jgi:peptidoglycan/xylan/chitin deacetylase (PgdA/CDA1 family)